MTISSEVLEELLAEATPGPWVVNPFNAQVDCSTLGIDGDLLPVCRMLWPTDERTESETEVNAQLTALTPDLAREVIALRAEIARRDAALEQRINDYERLAVSGSVAFRMAMELRETRAALCAATLRAIAQTAGNEGEGL